MASQSQQYSLASKFGHNPVYSESAEGLKNIKAICVGNGGVGKSNVVRHILGVGYLADYQPTYGVQFIKKDLQDNVRLQVWDMPGDDRFMKIAASYFKGAHLFIMVFDVNNRGSYEAIPHIEKYIEAEGKLIHSVLVVGNKTDENKKREVTAQEAQAYCNQRGHFYIDYSCKTTPQQHLQDKLNEVVVHQIANSLTVTNFSDDNYARQLFPNLYHSILGAMTKGSLSLPQFDMKHSASNNLSVTASLATTNKSNASRH